MNNPWKTLSTRLVYENRWVRVREDRVIRPDGREGIYGVIEIRPSIGVVAVNERREVALVGQWRYAHNKYSWEIPRGGSHEGETDLVAAAQRELREEAGLAAARWEPLGEFDLDNGVTNDTEHVFLATGLTEVEAAPEGDEEIVLRWVPVAEAVGMALAGRITECCTIAALLKLDLLQRYGRLQLS